MLSQSPIGYPKYTQMTSKFKITFRYNLKTAKFNTKEFSANAVDHRVSFQEVNQFLKIAENCIYEISKKNKLALVSLLNCIVVLLMLLFGIILPTVLAVKNSSNEYGNIIGFVFGSFIGGIVFLVIVNAYFTVKRSQANIVMRQKVNEEYKRIADKWQQKGLTWRIPEQFPKYLELWNDFAKSKYQQTQQKQIQFKTDKKPQLSPFGQSSTSNFSNQMNANNFLDPRRESISSINSAHQNQA